MFRTRIVFPAALFALSIGAASGRAQTSVQEDFRPTPGQPGKDVVWVPTPEVLVERMLDVAKVTPEDYVVDLGSGDGRNVIAAAKRGARALGVEYNPDMVALSRRNAARENVADRARFVEGDMFAADFSDATVLALFLLPDNMLKLRDKFLDLRPGSRIVANTFGIEGWEPDVRQVLGHEDDCATWCTVLLWIVPARVGGTWQLLDGELTVTQEFQRFTGTLTRNGESTNIIDGRLVGAEIQFTAGAARYTGVARDGAMSGVVRIGDRTANWTATRTTR